MLDAAARSRHAGVPTSALLNLTKGNDSAQKVAYQVKTLVAAGLVRKREALLDGERREKTSVHYLRRFAPAPDFNASVDAEGEQNYLNARDIEEIAAVFAGSMYAHGGERGAMFQSDLGVELYRWLKERKGWTDEEIENPGAKSRIGKIFARVKDHMVEKGTATAIVAIHDRESGDDAGTQLATEHPALRLAPGGSDDRDGEDGEDGDGFGVGGGELLVNSVIEDQIVALCKAAGDGGLRAHDLAARFKLTAKEFGKKLDLMFKYPNLYGVESTTKQEGKNQVRWIHYAGLKEAAPPGKEKGGGGGAGAKAADAMMRERQTLLRRHVDERGYVVKMFVPRLMGGWLNKPNPIDSKYVTRLCEDMVTTGQVRVESVTVDTVTSLGDAKVQDVLVAVDFPRLTDAVKRRIAVEIAETSKAMKQKWWSRAKDVYAITPPIAPEKKEGEEKEKEKEAPGVSGRELAASSPGSRPVALTFKNPGAKPRMRHAAMTDAMVTDPSAASTSASAAIVDGRSLPFKTFRSLYSLESGYVMANAVRLRYFHAFLVDEVFGGGAGGGADFNAGELCMARMPIELFLKLIPAPRKLCEVEAKMLATLQTLALTEKRLGDLTPEQELALVGSRRPPGTLPKARRNAAILTRQEAEKKLANLLKWLQTMGIVEKVGTGIYRLAPEVRFQTRIPREDEDDDAPGLWRTARVDSRAGHEEYWNALEATFKGMNGSKEKDKRGEMVAKPDMRGAFPSLQLSKNGLNSEKGTGICSAKTWSRLRDLTIRQRVVLLDELDKIRLNESEIRQRVTAAKKSDDEKENDENNADAEKAAARSVFLRATNVLTPDQVREIAARNTIPVDVLNHFVVNDWMRVVNQLTADGTISQEDVKANLKRKAEISREKAEKRELKRSKRDGATNARLPRLIAPGITARDARAEDDEDRAGGKSRAMDPMSALPKLRLRWTREMDKNMLMAVCRARVCFGESGKGFMENAALKGGGLPTDVHRCQRRWTKLSRQVPGIFGELNSLVPAMRERGATARERWASDRLLAKQRGETLADDDDVEHVGRSSDVNSNSWDSRGVWCVAIDDELAKGIDEALEKHPIAYAAAAEYHYARTRAEDSETDTDTEWRSDDEIPLARLVDSDSDSDTDSDSDSDADTDSDASDEGVTVTERRTDELDPATLIEYAHAVELVKMLVSFRDEAQSGLDPETVRRGTRTLAAAVRSVGEDRVEHGMGLLARAKLLAPRAGPAPGDVECMRFTDKFLKARDDADARDFGYAACPAAAESLRAGLASLTAGGSSAVRPSGPGSPGSASVGRGCARIPSRPSSAQVLAILAAIVSGEAELAPFDPVSGVVVDGDVPVRGSFDVFGAEHDDDASGGGVVSENALPLARVNLDVVVRPGPNAGSSESNTNANDDDDAVHSRVSEDAVVAAVESRGADGATAEELKALAETAAGGGEKATSDAKAEPEDATIDANPDSDASETTKTLHPSTTSTQPATHKRRLTAAVFANASIAALRAALRRAARPGGRICEVNGYHAAPRYVGSARATRFRLPIDPGDNPNPNPNPNPGPMIRPWLLPDGEVNAAFMDALKRRCVTHALKCPGVPERALVEHMTPALTPRCAAELVQALVDAGQLEFRVAAGEGDRYGRAAEPERYFFAPMDPRKWPMGATLA